MRTKIQRWGNSLGLRIPKLLAEESGVYAGTEVELSVEDGDIIVRPARSIRYRLKDLLEEISDENLHGEVDTGEAVGREAW